MTRTLYLFCSAAPPVCAAAYAQHPQLDRSIDVLRSTGVTVLYGEDGFTPNPPSQGRPEGYPWELALDAVESVLLGA
ncbi:hypothetical protein [Streptomyces sp. NPDC054863]